MAKKVKREYVSSVYEEAKEDILEVKKKIVEIFKRKMTEKGFKFYVELIKKDPMTIMLNHEFIVQHVETGKWVYINCYKDTDIQYNGKEYRTFHTIDINKIPPLRHRITKINDYGFDINKNNEIVKIGEPKYDYMKNNYWIKDYSREYKIASLFDSL